MLLVSLQHVCLARSVRKQAGRQVGISGGCDGREGSSWTWPSGERASEGGAKRAAGNRASSEAFVRCFLGCLQHATTRAIEVSGRASGRAGGLGLMKRLAAGVDIRNTVAHLSMHSSVLCLPLVPQIKLCYASPRFVNTGYSAHVEPSTEAQTPTTQLLPQAPACSERLNEKMRQKGRISPR